LPPDVKSDRICLAAGARNNLQENRPLEFRVEVPLSAQGTATRSSSPTAKVASRPSHSASEKRPRCWPMNKETALDRDRVHHLFPHRALRSARECSGSPSRPARWPSGRAASTWPHGSAPSSPGQQGFTTPLTTGRASARPRWKYDDLVVDNLSCIGISVEPKPEEFGKWVTTTSLGKFEKLAIAPVTPFTEIDD
jgi:hypothetical protein